MTRTPEVLELHAVPTPWRPSVKPGSPWTTYLEQCWAPVIGLSSVLLLPPVQERHLDRLLGQHLDGLARAAGQAPAVPSVAPSPTRRPLEAPGVALPAHSRMAQRLHRIATKANTKSRTLSR